MLLRLISLTLMWLCVCVHGSSFGILKTGGLPITSPLSGEAMETLLLPNRAIKRVVDEMKKRHASA